MMIPLSRTHHTPFESGLLLCPFSLCLREELKRTREDEDEEEREDEKENAVVWC
jgi:hypothetical protein